MSGEVSPGIIKLAKNEILIPITSCIDKCILAKSFPDDLKVADAIPVFEKEDTSNKANYRPISLLPIISINLREFFLSRLESLPKKSYGHNCVVL